MPKHAIADMEDAELRMNEPASPEEMERRGQIVAELHTLWHRPMKEEEEKFWRQFDAELDRERLTFR
jgi:hypothetical protein